MIQTALFGENESNDTGAACSADALNKVDVAHLARLTEQEFLLFPNGATADEVADRLRMLGHDVDGFSIRPRVTELKQRGILVETGTRRKNRKNNMCTVLKHVNL